MWEVIYDVDGISIMYDDGNDVWRKYILYSDIIEGMHKAFEEVSRAAAARGLRVTGTEIIGLIPKRVLLEAGRFYLERRQRPLDIPEEEIIDIAVKSMSLDDLKPFDPKEKVIEYLMD